MSFSLHHLSATVLVTAALAAPGLGQAQPLFEQQPDDRLSPSLEAGVPTVKVLGGKAFGSGERVSYTTGGTTYELTRFHGLYVDILLPDSWLGPPALSEEQVDRFVDRTDLTYQFLLELVGAPPAGDGPLPIVVFPGACGQALGCSLVGKKAVFMNDDAYSNPKHWREAAANFPDSVLTHELTHSFDVFSRHLSYVSDSAHGWTTFLTNYYFAYTREGGIDFTPEEIVRDGVSTSAAYFEQPAATWETCVRDYQCQSQSIYPNFAWGGFGLRLAARYGPQAVRGFTAFLRQYTESQPVPATPEEKNDLYLEALAAGTHRDLGCVADAWHWHVSDSLRETMRQLYGPNLDCEDRDHDGFSPIQGDCNDSRATIYPGAADRVNGADDDCDGAVDETVYGDPADGSFRSFALPAEISIDRFDRIDYQFSLKPSGRVQFELCTPLGGFAQIYFYDLPATDFSDNHLPSGGGCNRRTFSLKSGRPHFEVYTGEVPAYSLAIQKAAPWPLPPWARTAPPRPKGRSFVLTARTALPKFPRRPTQVRFWVSGQGFVGTVPYRPAVSFAWTPPSGVDPVARGLTYRAQILVDGVPAYEITPPQSFAER